MSKEKENPQDEELRPKVDVHPDDLEGLMDDMQAVIDRYSMYFDVSHLTNAGRRRKQGSGVRRYGFIDKTSDLAQQFPQYNPPLFNDDDLKEYLRDVEFLRNLLAMVNELARMISNALLVYGDEAYRLALRYYNSVRQLARESDPDAIAVFNMLQTFFRRPRRPGNEPAEPEVERDVRAAARTKRR